MKKDMVLVDDNDKVIGLATKEECHKGNGLQHRAFSAFIFNSKNQLLIQQRSRFKKLWPLYWSNTCCSHPRPDETYEQAATRRIKEELGISCKLKYLYKFQYQANFKNIGSENEMCAVLVGKSDEKILPDPKEIANSKFIDIDKLKQDMAKNPHKYTPWFKLEFKRILSEHKDDIDLNWLFKSN